MQASLQRDILRTHADHCCWVTAKNEESSPSASGSSGLQTSCATQAGSQKSNGYNCSTRREADACRNDIFSVDSEGMRP